MRRCDRYTPKLYDPFTEHHFENSLRKYEVSPHKKIKLRSSLDNDHHYCPARINTPLKTV